MLSFLTKKILFKETIQNGLDIHNHILPGIDDGAKNIDESLILIKGLQSLNIISSYATPHIMAGFYENNQESIWNSMQRLSQDSNYQDLNFPIYPSAEYMLDDNFLKNIHKTNLKSLMLKQHNYILVEMSYAYESPRFEDVLFKMQTSGLNPIMAHPERYNYWNIDHDIESLRSRNIHFQLNALSLSDYYGSAVQKKAIRWLKKGYYSFIGTDLHHTKHLNALQNLQISKKIAPLVEELWNNNKKLLAK